MEKEALKKRLKYTESSLNSALYTYLNSAKRMNRDRALQLRGKRDLLVELIKDYK